MPSDTILFSEMTPPAELEDEFNAWYTTEHIPIRMSAPGFKSAQRYRAGGTRNYLAVYEMTEPGALETAAYQRIKGQPSDRTKKMLGSVQGFTRYLGKLINMHASDSETALLEEPVLYPVFFQVPAERLAEFDAWNDDEHIPLLREDERWRGTRRFDIFDSAPNQFNRLALHYLSDSAVLESDVRKRARQTPWRNRLAQETWFKGHYLLFDRLGKRFEGRE
jgi:hypothetical protein